MLNLEIEENKTKINEGMDGIKKAICNRIAEVTREYPERLLCLEILLEARAWLSCCLPLLSDEDWETKKVIELKGVVPFSLLPTLEQKLEEMKDAIFTTAHAYQTLYPAYQYVHRFTLRERVVYKSLSDLQKVEDIIYKSLPDLQNSVVMGGGEMVK